MAIHPKLAFAERNLKVSFQTVPGWQELRIALRIGSPLPNEKVGRSGMVNIGTAITWGSVGGAELPPWESEWEVQSSFDSPATKDGLLFEHVARVKGMSHRYLPHLVHHMSITRHLFGDVTEMTVTGSAPIVDSQSITEAEVLPWLSDPSEYPGRWQEPGFRMEFGKGKKRDLGVALELVDKPTKEQLATLNLRLSGWSLLLLSYADEKGEIVDLLKQLYRSAPAFVSEGKKVGVYARDVKHAHRASRDAIANMLMKLHATVVPIASATITSQLT